jgi:predicted enzyme related to lactoylglutathione lyase
MKTFILGLRTVIYPVSDLEKAKAWYSQAFGVAPYFDQPFYVGFNIGGYELGLDPDAPPAKSVAGPLSYWGVQSCEAAFSHLLGVGATGIEEPHSVGDGIWVATVADPDGNAIGVIENPHFTLG